MSYQLSYQWQKSTGQLEFTHDGLYYVALAVDKLRAFENPTDEPHFILILHKGQVTVVQAGIGHWLEANTDYQQGDLSFRVTQKESLGGQLFTQGFEQLRAWLATKSIQPRVVALSSLIVLFIGVIAYQWVQPDQTAQQEIIKLASSQYQDDAEQLKALIGMRMKLAQQALDQERFKKATELADKVLRLDPRHAAALKIKSESGMRLHQTETSAHDQLSEELWVRHMLTQVGKSIAQRDPQAARLKIDEVLARVPEHREALEVKAKLARLLINQAKEEKQTHQRQLDRQAEAERRFLAGRELATAKDWSEAYGAFKQSAQLLKQEGLHPYFEIDLNDWLLKARTELQTHSKSLYTQAATEFRRGLSVSGLSTRAQKFRQALAILHKLERSDEEFDAQDLKQKVVAQFDQSLSPLYVDAITLQELEGCCHAEPKFIEIKNMAQYQDLKYFRMSEEAIKRCLCN